MVLTGWAKATPQAISICGHQTWGRLGPGRWSATPSGLRLLPTLPDPQTHHLSSHPNTSHTPFSWPLSLHLSNFYSSFMSQDKCHLLREAFPDHPFLTACPQSSASSLSWSVPGCTYRTICTISRSLCLPTTCHKGKD